MSEEIPLNRSIQVRSVQARDFDQWTPLWDGYNAFYGRSGDTALAPLVTQTTWSRFLDEYEPMHALVAERAGRLIGLVHFIYHRDTTTVVPICYLRDLYTAPDVRGQGVARALIHAVYDRAKSAGALRVYWLTHETNTTAMRLYDQLAEKSGFLQYRKIF
jgi:GNAT superfamily N-acetyltransferase